MGLQFLKSTVGSADDVLSWVDYLALPANGWDGDGAPPSVDPFSSEPEITQSSLPLSFIMPQAHAQSGRIIARVSSKVIGASLARAVKRIAGEVKENVPDALGEMVTILKNGGAKELREKVFSSEMVGVTAGLASRAGLRSVRQFLRGRSNARYHQFTILATVAYLEWESDCGKLLDTIENAESTPEDITSANQTLQTLECNGKGLQGAANRWELYKLYGRAFADTIAGAEYDEENPRNSEFSVSPAGHGALFHLNQIASHQLAYRAGGPKIKAIEGQRRIWLYKDSAGLDRAGTVVDQRSGDFRKSVERAYSRRIDIILEDEQDTEAWVELKSYKAKNTQGAGLGRLAVLGNSYISAWNLKTGTGKRMGLHRQFSLDRAAANVDHARLTRACSH